MVRSSAQGFTLIEILVVTSIISLLSSIILVSIGTARDKARIAAGQAFTSHLNQAFGADALGIWNLDEGSGTVAYNSSGASGVSGTITGATWTTGPNGKPALLFASGNNVNVGSIALPTNVTVSAWIQTVSAAQQPAFSNRGSGLYFGTSGGRFFTYYNSGSVQAMVSNKYVNDGKWHHVAWSSNGTTAKMYIDGQLDSSLAQTRGPQTGTGYIGHDVSNGEYFSGSIFQVAVYTQAL